MEHEKRVAKALGISDYNEGGRTHRCILRVCADVSLDSTDEDIVKTTKELPLLLRRAIETARRSCAEADSGVKIDEESANDTESDSDSGSSSTSDEDASSSEEEEESKLEGGSIGWPWKAKKAVMSKSEALKRQIESFYTGRLNSELNAAHARAQEYINKHHSKHLERAQHALSKERDHIKMRHGDDWRHFHSSADDEMHKMLGEGSNLRAGDSGEEWKKPLFDEMRRIRTSALNATHEYVNEKAPKWKSEMMGHGERALEIMKSI
jgi:hypothetical protein